jgi:hypothetical protein
MTACQRWLPGGIASWRRPCDGGFDAGRYGVTPIEEKQARQFVTGRHYSRSYPAAVWRYGLFDLSAPAPELAGVAVLSMPASKKVLTKAFPQLEPYEQSLELGRFVLADEVAANGRLRETYLVWRSMSIQVMPCSDRGRVSPGGARLVDLGGCDTSRGAS